MLPTPLAFRTVVAVAILAFVAGCLAAAASAQVPVAQPDRTLVAAGIGTVKVSPQDRTSNASILAAVRAADAKALPRAVADARDQAAKLAAAGGVTLGPLVSLANTTSSGGVFYGPYYGANGTFGPDRFCGTVRTRSTTIGKDGKRHFGRLRTHRSCRIPSVIQRTVQLTFALA